MNDADESIVDTDGKTAYQYCIATGNKELLEVFKLHSRQEQEQQH